jgi:hypothetical protein
MVHHCSCHLRNQREPNNNNRSQDYEHHYVFMARTVCPNSEAPGDDDESVHHPRVPVKTPANVKGCFATDTGKELHKENKKLHTELHKLVNFLWAQYLELLCTMEKMSIFDEMVDDPNMESVGSHQVQLRLQRLLPIQTIC